MEIWNHIVFNIKFRYISRELEDENSYPKMKKVITDQNENEVSSKEIDLGPVEMEE
mgnify:CR=1 FL=1